MASPALQSQANALNARMEGEAKTAIDSIEREMLRPLAQKSYECIVNCYKKAGTTGSNEQLEHCTRSCQVVHQQAHGILQQVSGRIDGIVCESYAVRVCLRCLWPIEPDIHACKFTTSNSFSNNTYAPLSTIKGNQSIPESSEPGHDAVQR